ncbi:Crp/Fnr family transcriptional regulator [Streptomyces lushanensis]|uniref:Crp/Fnr family transcriptional regulator n=1 Tax=Streptomyces lushanensis TaxID=1434255 RepID=UPI001FE0466C|nr:helix-turn-helix domain-containing protein [Streptomyces lushanensis]
MVELTGKLRDPDSRRLDLSSGSFLHRLARLLTTLATDFGRPEEDGSVAIPLRLSQQELASLLGASRESATRGLRLLREQGIISTRYRNIVIRDVSVLQYIADNES